MTVAPQSTGASQDALQWLRQQADAVDESIGVKPKGGKQEPLGFSDLEIGWDRAPFGIGTGVQFAEAARVIEAIEADQSGTITPEQDKFLREFALKTEREKTFWYKVGDIALDVPGFLVDIAAGFGLAGRAASALGKKGIKEILEGYLVNEAGKRVRRTGAKEAAKRIAVGGTAGVAGMEAIQALGSTIATGQPGTASMARTQQLRTPGLATVPGEGDEVEVLISGTVKGFMETLPRGILDTAIEIASEMSGGLIGAATAKLPAQEAIKKLQRKVFGRLAEKLGSTSKALTAITKGGWNGPVNEWLEEWVGHGARTATGLPTEAPGLAEFVAFSIIGAGATAGGAALGLGDSAPAGAAEKPTTALEADDEAAAPAPSPAEPSQRAQALLEATGAAKRAQSAFPSAVPVDALSEREKGLVEEFATEGVDLVIFQGSETARTRPAAELGGEVVGISREALESPVWSRRLRWHEPVHTLKRRHPEAFREFADAVHAINPARARFSEHEYADIFGKGETERVAGAVGPFQPGREPRERTLSPELLEEEGLAYRVEGLWDWLDRASTPEGLAELEKAAAVPSVWKRIVNAIRRMIGLEVREDDAMTALEAHRALRKLRGPVPPSRGLPESMSKGSEAMQVRQQRQPRRQSGALPAGEEAIPLGPASPGIQPETGEGIPEKSSAPATMPTERALFGEQERPVSARPAGQGRGEATGQGTLLDVAPGDQRGQQSILEATGKAKAPPATVTPATVEAMPQVSSAADLMREIEARADFEEIPATDLVLAPEEMQYKSGADPTTGRDPEGPLAKLKDRSQWSKVSAGNPLVYRRASGELVVVDGHQRVNAAKRLSEGGPPIMLRAFVISESRGVTPAQARAIGAILNVRAGTGKAVDAAKIIRDLGLTREDLRAIGAGGAFADQAVGLSRLADPVFSMVVNEDDLAANLAAPIGTYIQPAEVEKQVAVARMIARTAKNAEMAGMIAREAAAERMSVGQAGLFGESDQKTMLELRAEILSDILPKIRNVSRALGSLAKNAETARAQGVGEIDRARAQELAGDSKQLIDAVTSRAGLKGTEINAVLTEAATELARNPSERKRISAEALAGIEGLAERGRLLADRASGLEDDAGAGRAEDAPRDAPGQEGLRFAAAYQGSGADFDRHSNDYIGTGEGAHAYGWGHYFASLRKVAEWYRRKLTDWRDAELSSVVMALPASHRGTNDNARRILADIDHAISAGTIKSAEEYLDAYTVRPDLHDAYRAAARVMANKGRVYKVDLAPQEHEYLLWDSPIEDQSETVQTALRSADWWKHAEEQIEDRSGNNPTGESVYRWLTQDFSPQEASQELLRLGIRGNKYLDGTSRAQGEGSFNYVLFSPEDITIVEKFAAAPPPNSEAFRKWFGKSRVVDDEGRPLVVYHGTHRTGLNRLDPTAASRWSADGIHRPLGAIWFAENPALPNSFALKDFSTVMEDSGGQVLPVYVSLQNPLIVDAALMGDSPFEVQPGVTVYEIAYIKAASVRDARDGGYDGVIFANAYDSIPTPGLIVAAFRPEQIKSATGNRGTYSAEDPDIRFAAGDPEGSLRLDLPLAEQPGRVKVGLAQISREIADRFDALLRDARTVPGEDDPGWGTLNRGRRGNKAETLRHYREQRRKWRALSYLFTDKRSDVAVAVGIYEGEGEVVYQSMKQILRGEMNDALRRVGIVSVTSNPAKADTLGADLMPPGLTTTPLDDFTPRFAAARPSPRLTARQRSAFGATPVSNETSDFLRKWIDYFNPVKDLQKAVEAAGGNVVDVWQAEKLRRGRTGDAIRRFRDAHVEPLLEAVKAAGVTVDTAGDHFEYRHADERDAHVRTINPDLETGSGWDAERKAAHEAVIEGKNLTAIERLWDGAWKAMREQWVEYGLETQKTVDALEEQYGSYSPMRGFRDESITDTLGWGRGISLRGAEFRQVLGRTSAADNPLVFLLTDISKTMIRGEKARVDRALIAFVRRNPEMGWASLVVPQTKRGINTATGLVEELPDPTYANRPNVVPLKRNGKTVYLTLAPTHEHLAPILKGEGIDFPSEAFQPIYRATRGLAALSTRWNPFFAPFNFVRDFGQGVATTWAENGPKAAAKLSAQVFAHGLRYMGAFRWAKKNPNGTPSNEFQRAAQRFLRAGGEVTFLDLGGMEKARTELEQSLEDPTAFKRSARAVARAVGNAQDMIENVTRLAAFDLATQSGTSVNKAALLAKNLTTNFEQKGQYGAWINTFFAFANAGIQGNTRLLQALGKGQHGKQVLAATIGGALLIDMLNAALSGDDEDGSSYYDNIPDWEKRTNLILMNPWSEEGDYFKVPLPYGFNVLHVLGTMTGHALRGAKEPGELVSEFLSAGVDAFNPLGGGTDVAEVLAPTILDPVVQAARNRAWHGGPIRPPFGDLDRRLPDSENFYPSVNPLLRGFARLANRATGGSSFEPGWFDVSPETIEHIFSAYTGGLGGELTRVSKLPFIEDPGISDVPLARRAYATQRANRHRMRFTEAKLELDRVQLGYKQAEDKAAFAREHAHELSLARGVDRIDSRIQKLRDLSRRLEGEQKERIEAAMDRMYILGNRRILEANR